MISLDKNILDKNSAVAGRMIAYGRESDLFIIVPDYQKRTVELSPNVIVHSTGGNKLQQLFRLKKIGQGVIRANNIDLITTQDPFFTGLVGMCLKNKNKIKLEVQLHGDFFGSDYYQKSGLKNLLQYYIAKLLVIKKADKIRVVEQRIKNSLLSLGISEEKIEKRPIAVDIDRVRAYQPKMNLHERYPGYEKIFLSIGRLDPVKNIGFLIDIFAQISKERTKFLLLIVGNGADNAKLQAQAKALGLENNVKFENWTDDPLSYIKTADCVLFSSLSEGYGLVPMEAAVSGTLLIMSDVGVANFELKSGDKVKILPLDKQKWVKEILNIV